ncbi:MAG: radical SAM protein [Prevotellaceae bacterium]|jgi:radical SAM protein with 4Fe4S-binding SPASM domain|nr:radical SAM protein [Prevotellaceae bacterium]
MKYPALSENNIFPVPVGDFWQVEPERLFIVYAPLNLQFFLATQKSVDELEKNITDINLCNEQQIKLFDTLKTIGKTPVHYLPKTVDDLYQVDLLLNNTCNFRCTYCYSAAGRSQGEVKFEQVKAVVDYLFSRKQTKPYIIDFSGGGEPLLSFPLMQQTIEYIEKIASAKNCFYNIGLVTNGSLITAEIIEYLKNKNINMTVSFEILQHLQDMERGSYATVAKNIDLMLDCDYSFGIRTTFTPESVPYMTEMIEELHRRFPRIGKVIFDTVLSPDIFNTPEMLNDYYTAFLDNYFAAKRRGKELNVNVESIAVETLSILRERTCAGKITLTPEGAISCCSRVSSSKEALYNQYVYGKIDTDNKLIFDEDKLRQIVSENNIYSQPFCGDCFAKWNCGGGCRLFHQLFTSEFLKPKCDFTRQGLKLEIFHLLCANFERQQNRNLHSYISEKIKNGEI